MNKLCQKGTELHIAGVAIGECVNGLALLKTDNYAKARKLCHNIDPHLIFVVDASDRGTIGQARTMLHHIHRDFKQQRVLIYANKQGLPNAMNAEELTDQLDPTQLEGVHWFVQPTCAAKGEGLREGLDYLCKYSCLVSDKNKT